MAERCVVLVLLAGLSLPLGCAKKSAGAAAPMTMDSERGDDPLRELEMLEARMREAGLPVATGSSRSKPATVDAPAEAGEAAGGDYADDLVEGEMEGPVVEEAPAPADASPPSGGPRRQDKQERDRCSDLCSLSESICELEVRICGLSETHAGDPTYADACERAIDDCDVSGEACDMCDA